MSTSQPRWDEHAIKFKAYLGNTRGVVSCDKDGRNCYHCRDVGGGMWDCR